MPSMRHTPSRGCYGRLVQRGTSIDPDQHDEDSPLEGTTSSDRHINIRPPSRTVALNFFRRHTSSGERTTRWEPKVPVPVCWTKFSRQFLRVARFCLTNVVVAVCLLFCGLAMSLGPGLHTLLVADPPLMIDKSIKAFKIPNHIVTKRQDAFTSALSELRWSYSHNRGRRDTKSSTQTTQDAPPQYTHPDSAPPPPQGTKPGTGHTRRDSVNVWDGSKVVPVSRDRLKSHIEKSIDKFYTNSIRKEHSYDKYSNNDNDDSPEHLYSNDSNSSSRSKRSLPPNGRIAGITQAYRRWKMTLIYLAQGADKNMFTHKRLQTVHHIERKIMNHSSFVDFCYMNYIKQRQDPNLLRYGGCAPLNSLLTYFFPSKTPDGTVHYDGLGSKLEKLDRTLSFAMTRDTFFWYVDDKINGTFRRSRLLRSEVQFGAPLPGYISFADRNEEQSKKFRDFVITYIDMLEDSSTEDVMVLYGGNELFDYEVDATFWNDLRLSFYTLGFIVIFMFILTSFSLWLTCWGITAIILSFPLALFLYREVFGVVSLGILNGAAAFLIIGIGVDDVFVFINTFRQAHHMTDIGDRLVHTVYTAGKATFFTSFTTAAAFAANVASSIPAIHDFGLFMSLIVSSCWIMVVMTMPPVINIWARFFASCENACYNGCYSCKKSKRLEVPADIAHFLDPKRDNAGSQNDRMGGGNNDDNTSDDVPLLQMEDVNDHEGGWPIYLGMLNQMLHEDGDDPVLQLEQDLGPRSSLRHLSTTLSSVDLHAPQRQEGCSLTSWMQGVLFHFVATPIIKIRWVVLGVYCVVLVVSVGLMTQLHTATRPPQLFHTDTNLQRIMDLAANFSDSAITCDECSGFFKENPVQPHEDSTTTTSTTELIPLETIRLTPPPESPHWKSPVGATPPKTTPSPLPTQSPVPFTRAAQPGQQLLVPTTPRVDPESVDANFDPCARGRCNHQEPRPNLELGAVVHVVFGIIGIDRSNVSMDHVVTEKGSVQYDDNFAEHFQLKNLPHATAVQDLCRICKLIANNTKLVKPNGSQCIPQYGLPLGIRQMLRKIPECQNLPENKIVNGHRLPARAIASITSTSVQWIAFAFESTTFKGQSYFTAYNEYNEWEKFVKHLKNNVLPPGSPLINFYQTSDFWTNVMMEVVAVSSAIYGLVLSMIICITAVAIFTGHVALLLIVGFTIFGVICLVVAIFYLVGWEMGAVEAVSLSILVGSSVDYCVHLVEGYLLAGRNPPAHIAKDPGKLRRWRTLAAVSHIGVSITSSAMTTIVAAIPLTQTVIQPFSKFGQIVTINTSMSILYTLTACIAFLSLFAPPHHKNSLRSTILAFSGTVLVVGVFVLILFILSRCGVDIPAPNGENLFP